MPESNSTRPIPKVVSKREREMVDDHCKRIELLNQHGNDAFHERAILGLKIAKESLDILSVRHKIESRCCDLCYDAEGLAWTVEHLLAVLDSTIRGNVEYLDGHLPPPHLLEKWILEWREGIDDDYQVWADVDEQAGNAKKRRKVKAKG